MQKVSEIVSVHTTVRSRVPSLPFADIAHSVLGSSYTVSIVICGDTLARKLNAQYRKKTYSPNVLSFSLSKKEGEVVLNVRKAEREARMGGVSLRTRLGLLFVHACYHLKGHDHSNAMERLETKTLRQFGLL
jgi:rRNA maturation RNase YbeY